MLIRKKENSDAETFWKEKEETLGTQVLGRTLGRVIIEKDRRPLWGLFYTTQNAVYFQTFKSENWISTIFSAGKGSSRTQDETLEVSREALKSFTVCERKGGLFGFFKQPPSVEIVWTSAESGNEETLLFEMEGDAPAFVESFPTT